MRRRHALAVLYVVALAASIAFESWHGTPRTLAPGAIEVRLPTGRGVVELLAHGDPAQPVAVLLLHGCPGSASDYVDFASALAEHGRRVLTPSMPGFGASTPPASFAIPAQADALITLLDVLAIERVDLVAHSLGGSVAIDLAARHPSRVRSLTAIGATGVVELELFGRHGLNTAVHQLQLAALTGVRWGMPHFGAFFDQPFDLAYARSFAELDQRPARAQWSALTIPVAIVHGVDDFLVPPAVAREHARLAPQAVLDVHEGDHFDVFRAPGSLAARILPFLDAVDRSEAPTRDRASAERVAASTAPFDPATIPPLSGPALALVLVLLAAATFASEDLACIGAGLLVADGRLAFVPAALACAFGIWFGDGLLFLAGRTVGRSIAKRRPFSWFLSAAALERGAAFFDRHGVRSIFVSRFTPGLRLPTYVAAGLTRMPFSRFAAWFACAALLWTPALVGCAAIFGERALSALEGVRAHPVLAIGLVIGGLIVIERIVLRLLTWRGRRLLWSSWRRFTRWEYWPAWAFYPPVLLYVAWLALRHRSLRVLTAANPGIDASGIVGESKSAILRLLDHDEAREHVARFVVVERGGDPAARTARALEFMERESLTFPVVVKPDIGQRGSGVRIVQDADELARALESARSLDLLVQEHAPGPEFGVFYVRHPSETRGRIFSITEKRLPHVLGDGCSTLETLILRDARAVCVAPTYFALHGDRLEHVPAAGEAVRLAHIGNHCRGALFLDGAALRTELLELALDRVCVPARGFFFGRFDLKVASVEDLKAGRAFKIVELNGLTSEATHIYDPKHGLLTAYRVLFAQWRHAFAIAEHNARCGAPTTSVGTILRRWWDDRRRNRTRERA
ncbi:MAG: alpha/beta fold hydrolase [Planctomycetes bacterium]|nr:alpha/beta fold hydrolase [Planctomycetota bacterium]MCC7170736.1 alpha/beta fold hydrolase [Planctomycetota bacterium]